mmetsp:Transcript_11465/g.31687  ORF Transcript_11465/g.31687 Transcript_11465/m.31687 type:complete len:918 (-) Transcript_11465:2633-5386(-)
MVKIKSRQRQQQQQHEQLIGLIAVIAGTFFLLVVLVLTFLLPSGVDKEPERWKRIAAKRHTKNKKHARRLAVVLPFVGDSPDSVPSYLNLFCRGARAASDVADFFLVHNGILADAEKLTFCHSNVILINLKSTQAMAERLIRVLNGKDEETWVIPREGLVKILTTYLNLYPYMLVEFKPSYGAIFEDLLEDYSHWAYSDLDIVFGDLGRHIEESEWTDYDIVTWGFGDQKRLYLKGQFTMHKNTALVRQLWKGCDYLASLDERYNSIIKKKSKFQLESAEGCYSSVVLQNEVVSVKFGVKAWTDVSKTDSVYAHGLYLFQNPKHPHKHVLAKTLPSETDGNRLLQLPHDWFHQDALYNNRHLPLQKASGHMETLKLPDGKSDKGNGCMYWVQKQYQKYLCLEEDVSALENVFWINGELFKQRFESIGLQSKVDTGPFFHFQEFKRNFRRDQLAVFDDTGTTVAVLLPEGGIVVYQGGGSKKRHASQPSPLGIPTSAWEILDGKNGENNARPNHLPSRKYCLSGEPDKFHFRVECKLSASWEDVEWISLAPLWRTFSTELDVTLVQTVRLYSSDSARYQAALNTVAQNLRRWDGQPAVVLIYSSPTIDSPSEIVSEMFSDHNNIESTLIGVLSSDAQSAKEPNDKLLISQKSLRNMAMDVVPTRWYLSGLDQGDAIISPDTVHLARRKASVYQSMPGNIFYVPQFAFGRDELWDVADLVEAKEHNEVLVPYSFDSCDQNEQGKDDMSTNASLLWWEQTISILDPDKKRVQPSVVARDLQHIQAKLSRIGIDAEGEFMTTPLPQLLLVDNLLKTSRSEEGLQAHSLAREVEEFGGARCFNLLRTAQLIIFGFQLNVLEGAFAASTVKSRKGGLQNDETPLSPKCGGCFLLEGADDLRKRILRHEISRPMIARLLNQDNN